MTRLQHSRHYVISIILFWFIQTVYLDPKMKFLKSARLTSEFLPPTLLPDTVAGSNSDNTVTMANMAAMAAQITTSDPNPSDNEQNISSSTSSESNQQNFNTAFQSVSSNNNDSNSSAENRLRWVDFNRHQPFPSRLPGIPGIPSGFRNTPSTQNPFAITTATTGATEPPKEWLNGMYNAQKGNNANFMTSINKPSNSIGFPLVNPVVDDELLFSMSNPNLRLTRVEHIVAECSDEHMKVVVRFNGTFNGLIYSSGYVHDRGCIYVNGSGRSHYEFFIRLNQCGTLGRQEMYHPSIPGEARRRDQLMWNTLSIQYNPLIEEEFDEHFRLTCEYGSDFWKTVTFPSVNVEVNTGSPVVFTINPPQCQMEIRRGFGIAGTRTTGPVTVGDPLTLLIHMKSEKVGFDILVKNCVAHNGAQQRMQLIDANGCVTNDKLISPFRGTYNSDGGHQVSLFAYLKAFRFTGSLALYLECDIHMCHNRCPPQRCYWRNLSKRSAKLQSYDDGFNKTAKPLLSESISLFQALEVHHDQDEEISESILQERKNDDMVCLRSSGLSMIIILMIALICISIGSCFCYYLRIRRLKLLKSITYLDSNNSQSISAYNGSRRTLGQQHSNTNIDRRSIASGYSEFSSSSSLPTYPAYRGRFFRFY